MKVKCIWEHNENDSLIYSVNFIGAYARGESREVAIAKMPQEIKDYLSWAGKDLNDDLSIEIVQEKISDLRISDADSDVIFDDEKLPLTIEEYVELKALAMKSAEDFLHLYMAIPDVNKSVLPFRETFYGHTPRTAKEMYEHTKNVNEYYFAEIGIDADNEGTISECRRKGFEQLELTDGFLEHGSVIGSYGEEWSLRKVLRRFIWHDRIHAKAMYRMAIKSFGVDSVPNIFYFNLK